jgi:sialate O-acetylesterase
VRGSWKVCAPETVGRFSAVGYAFGRYLHTSRRVPVGLIQSAWGGTVAEAWTSRAALEQAADPTIPQMLEKYRELVARFEKAEPEMQAKHRAALAEHEEAVAKAKAEGKTPPPAPRRPTHPRQEPNHPCHLYNGMIAPLQPFAIRGVIWYQGESNAGRAYQYRTLLPAMIRSWRDGWGRGDFCFLIVQLAPFQGNMNRPLWPELREAQLLTAQTVPNVGMVVITDVGDKMEIHPKENDPVGLRLALAARALAYGEPIDWSGPVFDKAQMKDHRAILTFKHVGGGLVARDGPLKGFTICGPDGQFHPAQAEIVGDTIVVFHPDVKEPVAVRYGWENYPEVNLWNRAGLPATPFRTDDFPLLTGPKEAKRP